MIYDGNLADYSRYKRINNLKQRKRKLVEQLIDHFDFFQENKS